MCFGVFFFFLLIQVSIVGDFTEDEIEACILDYLGTVRATSFNSEQFIAPITFGPFPSDMHFQQVSPSHTFISTIFGYTIEITSSAECISAMS